MGCRGRNIGGLDSYVHIGITNLYMSRCGLLERCVPLSAHELDRKSVEPTAHCL